MTEDRRRTPQHRRHRSRGAGRWGTQAHIHILLLADDEYYGPEGEPFPIGSRLLYVVMTRARHQAHLVVPANSHPLWAPLIATLE